MMELRRCQIHACFSASVLAPPKPLVPLALPLRSGRFVASVVEIPLVMQRYRVSHVCAAEELPSMPS